MVAFVLIIYFMVMLIIGYVSSKSVKDADDFLIGGRKLGSFVTAIAHQSAAMSRWLFLAWAGMVFKMGFGAI